MHTHLNLGLVDLPNPIQDHLGECDRQGELETDITGRAFGAIHDECCKKASKCGS